jgi:hypothetical protein
MEVEVDVGLKVVSDAEQSTFIRCGCGDSPSKHSTEEDQSSRNTQLQVECRGIRRVFRIDHFALVRRGHAGLDDLVEDHRRGRD